MVKIKISSRNLWIVILASGLIFLLVTGVFFFLGYRSYKQLRDSQAKALAELVEQNKLRDAEQAEAQKLIAEQAEELRKAQTELTTTKSTAAKTNDQISKLKDALAAGTASQNGGVISSSDLAPYVTGVVQIMCGGGQNISSGSGTLWSFKELPYAVITNYHVVKDSTNCVVAITNNANTSTGIFALEGSVYTLNQNTDTAIIGIGKSISSNNVPVANYNYSLSKLRKCPLSIPVGSPAVIIGYPAYAKRNTTLTINTIGTVNVIYRTVTNGILSGYDTSATKPQGNLNDPNFFVSAKIDNGNSGGISLAKDSNGLCVLGLPTWLTVGNYETQGLVQNISNILP